MKIIVCIGSSCHLKGAREIVLQLQKMIKQYKLEEKVELVGSFCMGRCVEGVSVKIEEEFYSLYPSTVEEFFNKNVLDRL